MLELTLSIALIVYIENNSVFSKEVNRTKVHQLVKSYVVSYKWEKTLIEGLLFRY